MTVLISALDSHTDPGLPRDMEKETSLKRAPHTPKHPAGTSVISS